MYILGISGSPRRGGNSERLLDMALSGATDAGATVEKLVLNELRITPCQECGGCNATGRCVVRDDMQGIYDKLARMDGMILASPIFFSGVTAQLKAMIDRSQCRWVAKYVLKQPASPKSRPGVFICVRGQKGFEVMEAAAKVVKAFFATENIRYLDQLFVDGMDEKGAVESHPEILKAAYALGHKLAGAISASIS